MLLAIDVGNTNIVFGIHDGTVWVQQWRIQTVPNRMPDEYAVMFQSLLGHDAQLELSNFNQVIISSVVPQLTAGLTDMIYRRSSKMPLILTNALDLGIQIDTEAPERVGADILADCVAAYAQSQSASIVVDFGTATTFTAMSEDGVMRGTAIAAGLGITIDALVSQTAQLPQIELSPPPSIIARNTIHAMQAGLVVGYVAMVEGMINRIQNEMHNHPRIIATGGLSSIIAPLTDIFDTVDPWLTLEGLRLIVERNT
jgi:type III pantothenate kinase